MADPLYAPNVTSIYAVTNRHVVDHRATTIRLNTQDGGFDVLETPDDGWFRHPDGDDIAVCPIGLDSNIHKFTSVSIKFMLTREILDRYKIGPGDEACFVGRFVNHEGKQRNTPTLRFGNLAMMPWEPLVAETGLKQESYLVEARSLPGYSGSPVFVYDNPVYPRPEEQTPLNPANHMWGPYLLGIDWCHLYRWAEVVGADKRTPVEPSMWVKENTGMMGVIPAWKLIDILQMEEIAMGRREAEQRWLDDNQKASEGVSLDNAAQDNGVFTKDNFLRDLRRVTRRVEPQSGQAEGEK